MTAVLAVVHLVRHANGAAPFDAFMASYERCAAGVEHDLVLLFKGFDDPAAIAPYLERCSAPAPARIEVSDRGLDLSAYRAAAAILGHERLCFVNSFSEILATGWLSALDAAFADPGVGLAGATGSWASHRSYALSMLRLPNGYGASLGERERMTPAMRSTSTATKVSRSRRLVRSAVNISHDLATYPGFPAPHVRTNAFVIGRELLLSLKARRLDRKRTTYRFEAGFGSMTAQVRARGLATVVVARDRIARGPDAWPDADVFWQGTQRDLLVADNQTRAYEHGDSAVREALSRYAWGPRARWS
jgi:hypothetical protein